MIAVDTNILVRLITRDDTAQAEIADRVMQEGVLVSPTVLLELAWVLGGKRYRLDRPRLAEALRGVIDLKSVTVPNEDTVRWAIDRYAVTGDIADLIHIASVQGAAAFATLDDKLSKDAGANTPVPIRKPG